MKRIAMISAALLLGAAVLTGCSSQPVQENPQPAAQTQALYSERLADCPSACFRQ